MYLNIPNTFNSSKGLKVHMSCRILKWKTSQTVTDFKFRSIVQENLSKTVFAWDNYCLSSLLLTQLWLSRQLLSPCARGNSLLASPGGTSEHVQYVLRQPFPLPSACPPHPPILPCRTLPSYTCQAAYVWCFMRSLSCIWQEGYTLLSLYSTLGLCSTFGGR